MQNSNPNNGQHVILLEEKLTIPKFNLTARFKKLQMTPSLTSH